jgi:hypothetical protein
MCNKIGDPIRHEMEHMSGGAGDRRVWERAVGSVVCLVEVEVCDNVAISAEDVVQAHGVRALSNHIYRMRLQHAAKKNRRYRDGP